MEKKHILLLTTGGTIASLPGGEGLEPHRSDVMERQLNQLRSYFDITVEDLMCLDSSNIRPAEWQQIAQRVFETRLDYDGIVISHGTDTMAYTASMLSFMLKNIDIPDDAFKQTEAIIDSMTPAERESPEIINARRRERIAKGSGTSLAEVNRLLKQFEDTRKMMRTVAGGGLQKQMQRMQRGGGMRRR